VLFSSRAPVGYVVIANNALTTSQGFKSFVLPDGLESEFVYYYLRHIRPIAEAMATGTTFKELSGAKASRLPLLIAPLNEQKRIADKLGALLALVDECQAHLDCVSQILRRFRQTVLAAATSGKLTEEWRNNQTGTSDWQPVVLREVATEFGYGTSSKSQRTGKVPVLRMGNIQEGRLDWTDLGFTSDDNEIEKYNLLPGDVLFNRTNSPKLVGKTAVYKGERPAIFASYLIRVRCSERLLPDYLGFCLNSPKGRDWSWRVKSDGVSQSNINGQKLAGFAIELPEVDEQYEVVRRVENLFALADSVEARWQATRERVAQVSPSLLARAFRGELVAQDPNDESALVILERIRNARENAPEEPKKIRRRTEMTTTRTEKGDTRLGVIEALKTSGRELSAHELFQLAGYPLDAESEEVEDFFVEVRDALTNHQIAKERRRETDWFKWRDQ
jgi:type I restriction enzyme S subunit